MTKINKLHPYLLQVVAKSPLAHPNLDEEIRQATRRVELAEREFEKARKESLPVRYGVRPFTVEAIQLTAIYQRARRELVKAREVLVKLKALKRYHEKRR